MRTVTYLIKVHVDETADFEAATSTFEQYIDDYNEASAIEFGSDKVGAEIESITS